MTWCLIYPAPTFARVRQSTRWNGQDWEERQWMRSHRGHRPTLLLPAVIRI